MKKFIERQRMFSAAITGLLTGRQNYFATKISKLLIINDTASKSANISVSPFAEVLAE